MAYTPQIYYPSNYAPQFQAPQQNNNGLIWVTGEVGAKSYIVAPNNTVMLMDSEGDKFYIKSTDASGMPILRTFEYKEVSHNAPQATQSAQNSLSEQFVTRDEFNALIARFDDFQKPKTKKKEVQEDEQ